MSNAKPLKFTVYALVIVVMGIVFSGCSKKPPQLGPGGDTHYGYIVMGSNLPQWSESSDINLEKNDLIVIINQTDQKVPIVGNFQIENIFSGPLDVTIEPFGSITRGCIANGTAEAVIWEDTRTITCTMELSN